MIKYGRNIYCSLFSKRSSQTRRNFSISKFTSIEQKVPKRNVPEYGKYGQPTEWTHPHIIGPGEVNHGILRSEFESRRDKLVETLLADSPVKSDSHLLVLPSAPRMYMVDKIPYFYRQDTDFRYLTGCLQPDNVLVLEFSKDSCKTLLFCQEGSTYKERWEGPVLGFGEAVDFLGVDLASPLSSLEEYLYNYQKQSNSPCLWYDHVQPVNQAIQKVMLNLIQQNNNLRKVESPRPWIQNLRVIKSPAEINLMRKSCSIGAKAMKKTIARSANMETEGQFLASVDYESRMEGACHLAYPPVVAAGPNCTTIHYIAATSAVTPSDLMLMDAGCEYHGYSSDITRTWPVQGIFTEHQKCVYEAVFETQKRLISSIIPHKTTVDGLYNQMLTILGEQVMSLGLLSGPDSTNLLKARVHDFCPHHVSHYLGMDVHDTPLVSKTRPLEPGMIITLEPAIYVSSSKQGVHPEFEGLGVRIEDDILITENGVEVLSKDCPKSIEEIEQLVESGKFQR